MSNLNLGGEYPNQGSGIDLASDANQGAVNVLAEPLKIGTCIIWAGSGVPAIGGNLNDLYIRTDAGASETAYFYRCTVAGAAGAATWVAMSGA